MNAPRVCLAHPNPGPDCEPFIQQLIDRLPNVCDVLYGGHMPCFQGSGAPLGSNAPAILPPVFARDGRPATNRQKRHFNDLKHHLAHLRPDVLFAEYGPTGVAVAEACRQLEIPLVVKFHGYDCSVRKTIEKYRHGYERVFRLAAAIVCVSKSQALALKTLGARPGKLFVVPTGVDTDRFKAGNPARGAPHIAAMGRFVDKKAPCLTILAFRQVAAHVPEAVLTMAGDGPLRESCLRLSEALGLSERINFPGRLERARVVSLLATACVFVQHSVTAMDGDSEGTPNAVLEAAASGLPVVATAHAGIPEAVLHEETGLLSAEQDVAAMSANMLRLLRDSREAARMGRRGREHIVENYNLYKNMEILSAILREAANE